MPALKLSDFKNPEQEYQDVCALVNRQANTINHLQQKNAKLHDKNQKLVQALKQILESNPDQTIIDILLTAHIVSKTNDSN